MYDFSRSGRATILMVEFVWCQSNRPFRGKVMGANARMGQSARGPGFNPRPCQIHVALSHLLSIQYMLFLCILYSVVKIDIQKSNLK